MESDRLSPAIGLLEAISPDPDRPNNEILTYPNLSAAVKCSKPIEKVLVRTFYSSEHESAAQLAAAHKLAEYELIATAAALQDAQSPAVQRQLSQQFTQASIDLFGAPKATAATYLLEQLLTELCVFQTNYAVDPELLDYLLRTYDEALRNSNVPREYTLPYDQVHADESAQMLGEYLRQLYPLALEVFDGEPTLAIDASGILKRFELALEALKQHDPFWNEWQVLVTDDSCLSVNPLARQLVVGSRRASVELGELKGLFGHEVLVHALRASNGQHLSDGFEQGLPGYIAAEEGFACFTEHALSGQPPHKMYDRYLDVALALGTIDGRPRTRPELYRLVYARATVRMQAAGKSERAGDIQRETWAHVNRIFRGTLGNEIVGVFTKDIAYYQGYLKMTAYIVDELRMGTAPADLWLVLTLGKYDPTDIVHMLELAQLA